MEAIRSSGARDMTGHVAIAGIVSRGNGRRKPGSTRQLHGEQHYSSAGPGFRTMYVLVPGGCTERRRVRGDGYELRW